MVLQHSGAWLQSNSIAETGRAVGGSHHWMPCIVAVLMRVKGHGSLDAVYCRCPYEGQGSRVTGCPVLSLSLFLMRVKGHGSLDALYCRCPREGQGSRVTDCPVLSLSS